MSPGFTSPTRTQPSREGDSKADYPLLLQGKVKGKNRLNLEVLYYNARGLANEERLLEFEESLKKVRWDILGIAEVRRAGNELIHRKNGDYLYFYGETKGYRSVGFLVKEKLWNKIKEIKQVNERIICVLKLEIEEKSLLSIIQIYAPILAAEKDEIREFYKKLQETIKQERERPTQ